MTLAPLVLAIMHGATGDTKAGGPCFLHYCLPFSWETEFTKFISEEIATARSRHNSRRRRIPMPARPRHRARCNHHEARAGKLTPSCRVVSYGSAMEVCLGPPDEIASRTHRSIRCGAALASRQNPLGFSGNKRGRSNALFSLCLTEHPSQIQNQPLFMRPRELGLRTSHIRDDRKKISSPLAPVSLLVLQLYLATLRTPTRLVTTPHSSL